MNSLRTGIKRICTLTLCVCLILSVSFFAYSGSLTDTWKIRLDGLFTTDMMLDASVSELLEAMDTGKITSEELVGMYLARIEAYDKELGLNSFITVNPDALEEARAADDARARGETGKLLGIPVIVKDNINVKGLPTTNGYSGKRGKASSDAEAVRWLREEGAVIIGKGNMCTNSFSGLVTRSSSGGTSHNPYDTSRTPAGSSGGPAIAVTCNFAAIGIGSDTNSSIRRPASFANIYGYRPSAGLVSRKGLIITSGLTDTIGILARSVEDTALVLDIITGSDSSDTYSAKADSLKPEESYSETLNSTSFEGLRIGYMANSFGYYVGSRTGIPRKDPVELSPAVKVMVEEALEVFTSNGAELVDISGVLTERVITRLLWGSASKGRETVKKIFEDLGLSAIVYVSQTDVPEIESKANGKNDNYAYYLSVFSPHVGLPEIMVPMGLSETDPENGVTEPLPLGLSIVGLYGEDAALLSLASEYERLSDMRHAPGLTPALPDAGLEQFAAELMEYTEKLLEEHDLSLASRTGITEAYDALRTVSMSEEEGKEKISVAEYRALAAELCAAVDSPELIISAAPVTDVYTREFYLERYRRGIMASAVSVPILVTAAAVAIHSHRKKKKTYSSIPKME